MIVHFKKVRYKNLLSSGNVFTEINLEKDNTTLISGTNGSGKSTVIEAIIFGLYGKPFRKINKPQLVNSINQKELLVEVEFNVSGNHFLVRRGIKPTVFEIYKNGELINQESASRDYQSYLEQNILNMNYKSFNQIVVLGSATYVPFMELPAHSRREIIEDLLDIQVFSTMNLLLKERSSENKNKINDISYKIELLKSKIETAEEHNESIKKIREDEVKKIKERMNEHLNSVETEKKEVEEIQEKITEIIHTIEDKKSVKTKYDKARDILRDLENQNNSIVKELYFYNDNDNCPTCKQGIEHDFKNVVISEKNLKIQEIIDGKDRIKEKIEGYENRLKEISSVEDEIQSYNLKISEKKAQIKISINALKSLKKELDSAEEEVERVDTKKIEEFTNELKKLQEEHAKLFEEKELMSITSTLLKDGGIKSKIIKQYIPVMNKLINKYLASFDLFVDFQLDENFNEVIKSRFRDTFSYASFSEGEKLKINLSIMLSWRAVAKLRNSMSTNLMFLDEILDGPADSVAIENLIEILHNLNTNDNIFVISHRGDQFGDKFQSHIKFGKVKNFSQILN